MSRNVNKILVIRLLINMAKAVFTQNIPITAFGLENQTGVLESDLFMNNLNFISRAYRNNKTIFDSIIDTIALSKLIRNENPDIVHVNALQDLLSAFTAVHIASSGEDRPAIIAMAHSPLTWEKPWSAWLAAQMIRLFADGFISLATTNKCQLVRLGIPEDRITVIPNPFDVELIKRMDAPSDRITPTISKERRIVYVAHISERKAQDMLIRAAYLVLKKYPSVRFDLVGGVIPGEEKYAKMIYSLTQELNIQEHIHFSGAVSYQEAIDLLSASDIFVFPSHSEMMPRAVIEAMVAGKPVIASAVDGILDLIENRKTGILIQPGNVEELANSICEFIEDPAFAKEIGMSGKEYIRDYCSPERVGILFRDFYNKTLQASS